MKPFDFKSIFNQVIRIIQLLTPTRPSPISFFWFIFEIVFSLHFLYPFPLPKPSHIPLLTFFQIHDLFSSIVTACVYLFVYTYVLLNITFWLHIMLLICVFRVDHLPLISQSVCSSLRKTISFAATFTQLPVAPCVGLSFTFGWSFGETLWV